MANENEKELAARAAVAYVDDGNIVGLGTGSTAAFAVRFLAERVQAGLRILGIPTSKATHDLAVSLRIPLTTLDEHQEIDVAIDGADEIDPQLQLIKGGGGAFLREKIVESAARRLVIIADSSKQVAMLGNAPVPVEVIPFAWVLVAKRVEALGASIKLRTDSQGKPYITDEGHNILDCHFGQIPDPATLGVKLEDIPGVVEHGLFVGMATIALIGKGSTIVELNPKN